MNPKKHNFFKSYGSKEKVDQKPDEFHLVGIIPLPQ